ncbi:MAG: four helix bundle protein [Verrucomicrobia bacterium]|nr:four helix bundle protein [Verrucomicrobiota bacterium]
MEYRNKNRGYQQLRVWQDAVEYYRLTCPVFRRFPYELRRVSSQAIAASDSIHRNIAEGYCRRSIREYIQFLYVALGSLGESVSGLIACQKAEQLTTEDFETLNNLAFKLENGLLKLVESLEHKKVDGSWVDSLMVKESNAAYGADVVPTLQHSNTP